MRAAVFTQKPLVYLAFLQAGPFGGHMKIDVIPVYGRVLSHHISSSTVIAVDVLRSTSCIITAVGNGANRVVPAIDPGEAAMLAGRLGHADVVLAGERDAVKLPDFDIGNSPSEYSANTVKDRSVIISTTNGTAAIHGMSAAKDVLIGGMINRSAVAKRAVELGNDIIIVCAGTYGQISADDLLAAGSIAEAINRLSPSGIDASDITMVCCMLYADWKQGRADLSVTKHCARLIALGFEEDIRYCFSEDITDVVPVYENGVIR